MRTATTLLALAAMAVPALAAPRPTPEQRLEKLLEGRVAGTPTACIPLTSIQSSEIIDGQAIVYRSGGRMWVNRPRAGADLLDRDDILVSQPFSSRLCSIDIVRLIDRASRFQHGFVSLGDFVPYERVKTAG